MHPCIAMRPFVRWNDVEPRVRGMFHVQSVRPGATILSGPDTEEPDEHRRWTERTRQIAQRRTG